MNSDTWATLTKDIENYKEKITVLEKELTEVQNKYKELKQEIENKEMAITKLGKGNNCYLLLYLLGNYSILFILPNYFMEK